MAETETTIRFGNARIKVTFDFQDEQLETQKIEFQQALQSFIRSIKHSKPESNSPKTVRGRRKAFYEERTPNIKSINLDPRVRTHLEQIKEYFAKIGKDSQRRRMPIRKQRSKLGTIFLLMRANAQVKAVKAANVIFY